MRRTIPLLLILFTSLILTAQSPCKCCAEEYRQFDFWIGHWNVYDANEKLLGTSIIELIQDSCIILENWKSATSNYTGTSYNFYNIKTETWTQTWIDNQGGSLIMKGQYAGNNMTLTSEPIHNKEGISVTNKITWTNNKDGTVRQLWESKTGDGDWIVAFDGKYFKGD
jgi:hypothetical protein